MDPGRDGEQIDLLAKRVRLNLADLRRAGVDERPLDAIDRDVTDLQRLGRRAYEEVDAYRSAEESLKAGA